MYRIGIDLGGTNIAVGVVNDRYEIVARRSVPTGAERPAEEVIRDMATPWRRLCGRRNSRRWTAPLWALAPPVPATPRRGW